VWWWETVGGWRARCTFKWDIFCEAPVSAQRLAVFGVGGERTSFPAPERMAVVLHKLCTDVKKWKVTAGHAQQHWADVAVTCCCSRKALRRALALAKQPLTTTRWTKQPRCWCLQAGYLSR
jgi:hypothetical protein